MLKNICAYIADHKDGHHNIIAANEGAAVGLAAGHYLATGHIPVVYMQNSGEGNIINPLASLTDKDVYSIPLLLLIGWRGMPGVHDEPQHVKQGKVTIPLLDAMGIKHVVMSKDEKELLKQIEDALFFMETKNEAFAFVIEKDTFDSYELQSGSPSTLSMSREETIQAIASSIGQEDCIVSTTGMISRELFEHRTQMKQGHEKDFLTVGSMGHASQIALGIALEKTDRRIWCFDGDGAVIMHMGLDIDLPGIARSVRYNAVHTVSDMNGLKKALSDIRLEDGPVLLEVKVRKGNRKDLGRPTTTPIQNKEAFMGFLQDKELN